MFYAYQSDLSLKQKHKNLFYCNHYLINNPDMMRNMMMNNSQMQAMMDANPQMRHVLNDPSVRKYSYTPSSPLYFS
jgi:hypothetical protein